jgi:hypothetical protein
VPSQRKHDVKLYLSRSLGAEKGARTKKRLDRLLKKPSSPLFKYKKKSGLGIQRSVPKSSPKKPGFYPPTDTTGKFKETHERWWVLDKDITDVDFDKEISEPVIAWRDLTNKKAYVHIYFEMVRYIPFNPAYKGELVKKQGQWLPEYPISTSYELMPESIKRAVHFTLYKRYNYGQTRHLMILRFKAGLKERDGSNVGTQRKDAPKTRRNSKGSKKKALSRLERRKR